MTKRGNFNVLGYMHKKRKNNYLLYACFIIQITAEYIDDFVRNYLSRKLQNYELQGMQFSITMSDRSHLLCDFL